MTDVTRAEIDSATAYDELFVPALFRQWAPRVVEAARIAAGERVLDVACGTGVLAREAARAAGPSGRVAGLDASPGMLAVASRAEPAIEWRHGTAEALPFADGTFDAVVSQFGLMFFGDRGRALREMRRVLAARGRVAVAVWSSLERTPAYAAEVRLVERVAGPEAAGPLRAPFALGDPAELSRLFGDAGFVPEVATHRGTGRFPGVRTMVEADLRGWLPLCGVVLAEEVIARVLDEAERELAAFVAADGSVAFEAPAHVVVAVPS